jgi:beta-glucosidase/6-phospho-beta-glucosidase/beta-galactosidase
MVKPPNHVEYLVLYFSSFLVNVIRKYVCNSNNLYLISIGCRNDFATYAETCFQKFGDRVKNWITFNEPHTFAVQGYDVGLQAPGRCSILLHLFCRAGNSAREPYIVAHNVLLSHATVTDIYRKKYKV